MLELQTVICLMKRGGIYHLTVRSDCSSLWRPEWCWPWWHIYNKLSAPHMKASCLRLTEQFHSIEIHFDITGDVKPFWELLWDKILSVERRAPSLNNASFNHKNAASSCIWLILRWWNLNEQGTTAFFFQTQMRKLSQTELIICKHNCNMFAKRPNTG